MRRIVMACLLFAVPFVSAVVPAVAANNCSFKKALFSGGYSYDVNSHAGAGCGVQVIDISMRKGKKLLTRTRIDVDQLAYSAVSADLTGDHVPELVVISKSSGTKRETLDVYSLDGTTLRKTTLPAPDDISGYRGNDSFWVDGNQVIRSFSVYDGKDAAGKLVGTRTLKYEFTKEGKFALYVQTDTDAPVTEPAKPAQQADTKVEKAAKTAAVSAKTALKSSKYPKIIAIEAGENAIDIKAESRIVKYKFMRLDKPERLAIDIAKATSSIDGKFVTVGKFGIAKARIGRNPEHLRIVFDASEKRLPAYTVVRTEQGLQIKFAAEGK